MQCDYGSTFASLESSVILQGEMSDEKIEAIVNHFDRENASSVFF